MRIVLLADAVGTVGELRLLGVFTDADERVVKRKMLGAASSSSHCSASANVPSCSSLRGSRREAHWAQPAEGLARRSSSAPGLSLSRRRAACTAGRASARLEAKLSLGLLALSWR